MMKYGRCAKCHDFYLLTHLTCVDCTSCTYRTYRCDECGGKEGADRSIRVHFAWWRKREMGGHERKARGRLRAVA